MMVPACLSNRLLFGGQKVPPNPPPKGPAPSPCVYKQQRGACLGRVAVYSYDTLSSSCCCSSFEVNSSPLVP